VNGQRQSPTMTVASHGWTFTKAISEKEATRMLQEEVIEMAAKPKEAKKQ